jgi:myo-inositol-1(or 4)-monophosphatase
LVAKGKIDIAISFTKKNDWDLAAADLIIREAHGTILETNGKKIIYNTQDLNINSIMAANDVIISDLKRKFNYS